MSRIRSEGGKADRKLGSALHRLGFRFRRQSSLIGRPDFVFPSAKTVIFVDGDFWHGRFLEDRIARGDFHRNVEYWASKLRRNRDRDLDVTTQLEEAGWLVIRVWESDLQKDFDNVASSVAERLRARRAELSKS